MRNLARRHRGTEERTVVLRGVVAAAMILAFAAMSSAQSLEERLDEDQFLRGLTELRLPELLEQYIATHPTTDPARVAAFDIARQRLKIDDPAATPDERLAGIEQILHTRAKLIAQQVKDDRRATWLADQAADLFFALLPIDAAGVTTIAGVPSPAQRERASRVAREMNANAARAEIELEKTLFDLQSTQGFANNPMLQQRRTRLNEQERQRRIPFLRGVGACLQAQINVADHAEQQKLFTLAPETLLPLASSLDGAAAIQARLYAGLAQVRLGQFESADSLFNIVINGEGATASDVFLARLGIVMNRTAKSGPAAGLEALDALERQYAGAGHVFQRLAIADQRFLLRRSLANQAPAEQREQGLRNAYAAYIDLLNADLGAPPQAVRAAVFAKLAEAADAQTPLASLPAIVSIARAEQLSRSEDVASRQTAIAMFDDALKRADLSDFERSTARFGRSRALFAAGQPLIAAQGFLELAEQQSSDPQAARAIELAASIAAEQMRASAGNADAKTLLHRALDVLLKQFSSLSTINRWRLAAGQLAMDENRLDDASKAFEQVASGSSEWPDAQYLMAITAVRRAAASDDPTQARRLEEQAIAAIDNSQRGLSIAIESERDAARKKWLESHRDLLTVQRAQAEVNLNQPRQALELLAGFKSDSSIDRAVLAEALRVRFAAYKALKQPEAAAAEIERFLDASPESSGGGGGGGTGGAIVPMMESLQREVQALIDDGKDSDATDLARRTLLPVAKIVEQRVATMPGSPRDHAIVEQKIADAYRLSGENLSAVAIYERLLVSQPDATPLLMGRAECLYQLGGEERLAEAMNVYKRIAAAGTSAGAENYWLSQLRMLQVLDTINRNTAQIVPRIERLRQQDPNFGGERFRRGFDYLRQKWQGK